MFEFMQTIKENKIFAKSFMPKDFALKAVEKYQELYDLMGKELTD